MEAPCSFMDHLKLTRTRRKVLTRISLNGKANRRARQYSGMSVKPGDGRKRSDRSMRVALYQLRLASSNR
jgi:hypothetical protein